MNINNITLFVCSNRWPVLLPNRFWETRGLRFSHESNWFKSYIKDSAAQVCSPFRSPKSMRRLFRSDHGDVDCSATVPLLGDDRDASKLRLPKKLHAFKEHWLPSSSNELLCDDPFGVSEIVEVWNSRRARNVDTIGLLRVPHLP